MKKIVKICLLTPPSVARKSERGPALQQELQAHQSESNEVRVSLLVDKDTVPCGIFPERKFARNPCTSAWERPPVSSLTFSKVPTLQARAVDQVVAAVPKIKAVERLASRFGLKPLSPKAEEELIVAVACQESTQTQGDILKANETETKSARCRAVLIHARSSVSRAFVVK